MLKSQNLRTCLALLKRLIIYPEGMYRRADTKYGCESPLSENAKYVSDGENGIAHAWKWLGSSGKLSADDAAVNEV